MAGQFSYQGFDLLIEPARLTRAQQAGKRLRLADTLELAESLRGSSSATRGGTG
jgi:hypothetical protein